VMGARLRIFLKPEVELKDGLNNVSNSSLATS